MGIFELFLILLLILWVFGGVALPATGGLINLLLVVVLVVLIVKVARSA